MTKASTAYGWWVDDLQLYSCVNSIAAAPATTLATSGATAATVTWSAPSYVGSDPVTGYHVTTSTGKSLTLASTARSLTLSGLNPATSFGVHVAALTARRPGCVEPGRDLPRRDLRHELGDQGQEEAARSR